MFEIIEVLVLKYDQSILMPSLSLWLLKKYVRFLVNSISTKTHLLVEYFEMLRRLNMKLL